MVEIDIVHLPKVINGLINDYLGSPEVKFNTKEAEINFPLFYAILWMSNTHRVEVKGIKFFSDPEKALMFAVNHKNKKFVTYIVPIIQSVLILTDITPI